MATMDPKVDNYLAVGCGRCKLGGTPDCKVHNWEGELEKLRAILLETELTEELKWSVPCYTYEGGNVLLMSAFKEFCSLSFFKGVLLKDPQGILVAPGENSQAVRMFKFTSVDEIKTLEPTIKAYIQEAIEVEKAGLEVEFKKTAEYEIPEEFQNVLDNDPALKMAFEALTPGRQRGYLLYFSSAKQPQTRINRIEKYTPMIMEGIGMHDRY